MAPLFENTAIPPRVATGFAIAMQQERFQLDFTLDSLRDDLETILHNPDYLAACVSMENRGVELIFDFQTAAACYLGQTLAKVYGGSWQGHCSRDAKLNFYTLWLAFGEYRFYPIVYVLYRTGNGVESTGSIGELLDTVTPSLEDGIDYKQREHEAWMAEGRPIFDKTPWV